MRTASDIFWLCVGVLFMALAASALVAYVGWVLL